MKLSYADACLIIDEKIKNLETNSELLTDDFVDLLTYKLSKISLAKQVPIKTKYNRREKTEKCPLCGTVVSYGQNFCQECGQKFEWDDENV